LMMIPIILFLGLNPPELVLFEIFQTIFDFVFIFLLLYIGMKQIRPEAYSHKKVLITCLGIEGVHMVSSFMWYFFVLYAIGGFIIELLFLFIVPYFVIYLFYTPHSNNLGSSIMKQREETTSSERFLSTGRALLLYVCSVPPALIISSVLTSTLFNLIGMHNTFIFS
jgi:hypothetical protein